MSHSSYHRQRIYTLIAGSVGIISLFLPWFTVSASAFGYNQSKSTNGFEDNGSLVFIAFIASIVACFIGDKTRQFVQTSWYVAIASGGVALIAVIMISARASNRTANFGFVRAELGVGYILAVAAAIAIISLAWFYKKPAVFQSIQSMAAAAQATVEHFKTPEIKQQINLETEAYVRPDVSPHRDSGVSPEVQSALSTPSISTPDGSASDMPKERKSKNPPINKIDEMERLIALKERGYLTHNEFEELKKSILA
jgi:hypothetical protein